MKGKNNQFFVIFLSIIFCERKADKYWIRFVMQPLQNPPLYSSTVGIYVTLPAWHIHRKKKVREFPVPSRDVTNQTPPG
jgi:hypothetical protein